MADSFSTLWGWRTSIAEWASILALIASAYSAWAIYRVKGQVLGRVRLPNLVQSLEAINTTISTAMRDFDSNRDDVDLALSNWGANLKVLKETVKGDASKTAKNIIAEIIRFQANNLATREDAWKIYRALNGLIEELKYMLEDQRVGG